MHQCLKCDKVFQLKRYLTKHEQRMHNGQEKKQEGPVGKLKCSMCEKSFPRLSHLQRHQMSHLKIKEFACDFCEERFVQKAHLSRHVLRKHEKELNKELQPECSTSDFYVACPKCGCLFKTDYEMTAHRKTVHRPGRCHRCRKIVYGLDTMRIHEMRCRNEARLCPCGATFKRLADLNSHQNSCLRRAEFQCVPCEQLFKQRVQLDRHIKKLHFKSEKCGKCSYLMDSPVHKAQHSKECLDTIVCGYCGAENPEDDHIPENHWIRHKKPVKLMNQHSNRALLKKHQLKPEVVAKPVVVSKPVAEAEEDSESESSDSESEDENDRTPPASSIASSSSGSSVDDDDRREDLDKSLDGSIDPTPDLELFDFEEEHNRDSLMNMDNDLTKESTSFFDLDDDWDSENEVFLKFEISPSSEMRQYIFKGKLPKELAEMFPVLDETTIVLLDGIRPSHSLTVQVPVTVPKLLEEKHKKWLDTTIKLI